MSLEMWTRQVRSILDLAVLIACIEGLSASWRTLDGGSFLVLPILFLQAGWRLRSRS